VPTINPEEDDVDSLEAATGSLAETVFNLYSKLVLDGQTIIAKWQQALEVDGEANLLESMALVSRTVSTLGFQVQASKLISEKAKQNYAMAVRGLLDATGAASFHQPANSFVNRINADRLNLVLALDDILKHEAPVPILPPDDVARLTGQIEAIIKEIEASSLLTSPKECMLSALRPVLWALKQINVLGPRAIRAVVFSVVSTLQAGPDFDEGADAESSTGYWGRVVTSIKDVLTTIDGAELAIKRGRTVLLLGSALGNMLISSAQ
jgi:hypothetical protein